MKNILTYFFFLIQGQGIRFVFFIFLNVFLAISKSVSILLLLPLFEQFSSKSFNKITIFPFLENFTLFTSISTILLSLFFLLCFQTLIKIIQNRIAIYLTENFIFQEKKTFLNLLKNCTWLYFKKQKSSEFYHSFLNQIDYLGNSLHRFSNLIEALILCFAYSLSIFFLTKQTAFYIILGILPLIFFHAFLFYKSRVLGKKENENSSQEIELFKEQLMQFKQLKLSEKKESYFSKLILFLNKLKKTNIKHANIQNISSIYFDLIVFISFVFVYYLLPTNTKLDFAQISLVLLFLFRLAPIFNRFLSSCVNLINSYPYYQSYQKLKTELSKNQEKTIVQEENEFSNFSILLKNLSFSYSKEEDLIKNFNCEIKKDQMNVLIGPSGSGKTTFLEILVGLIKPQFGEIILDGNIVSDKQIFAFRKKIGYVSQEVMLLNTSIYNNLCFLHEYIAETEIQKIIQSCEAFSFINKLPEGLKTVIGENGIQISGGERQRIAILKELLKNPSLFILDEATNSIDEENELLILNYLMNKTPKITILLVSHRKHLQEMAQHKILLKNSY